MKSKKQEQEPLRAMARTGQVWSQLSDFSPHRAGGRQRPRREDLGHMWQGLRTTGMELP